MRIFYGMSTKCKQMAHINGIVYMVNSLHGSIAGCNSSIIELNKRLSEVEGKGSLPLTNPGPTSHDVVSEVLPLVRAELEGIRSKLATVETFAKDALSKERAIIESIVMARTEELVKNLVRERVAAECEAVADKVLAQVEEKLETPDFDTLSITQSEAPIRRAPTAPKKRGAYKKSIDV